MITQIKCYRVDVSYLTIGFKTLNRVEISNQLELPIADSTQLDGVLDASKISLLNQTKTPLKPFTKIIIEITDTTDGVDTTEKIYRFVDNDNVSNFVRGNQPLYRHAVSLIEPTKILERIPVDNLTFTNYLPHNYGISEKEVSYSNDIEEYNIATPSYDSTINKGVTCYGYTNDFRLMGPNVIIGTNISTQWRLKYVGVYASTLLAFVDWFDYSRDLNIESFTVKTPSKVTVDLINSSSYTVNETGYYTFTQVYTYYNVAPRFLRFRATATWTINVISSANKAVREYTIFEVLQRLINIYKVKRLDDKIEYVLDKKIINRLNNIPSPEFSLTDGTLFEALYKIGEYIHAIPRLIPNCRATAILNDDNEAYETVDDWSDWNVITFDFLGDKSEENRYTARAFSLIDLENPLDEFATEFVSNVENSTLTNYDGVYSIEEPFKDMYLSLRTDDSNFEVSDNAAIAKTREGIRYISQFVIKVDFGGDVGIQSYDITERVIEKTVYDTKNVHNQSNTSDMKIYFLYYEEGEPNIYGFTKTSAVPVAIANLSNKESIKAIIELVSGHNYTGNIKDISYHVEYIPYINFKAKQFKTLINDSPEKSSLYYNQQSNETDIAHYGEAMHFALVKTGNVKYSPTQYFNSLADVPKIGQWTDDGYFCFQVNREITFQTPIKATTFWSKDYNELFADIAVKRAIRQSEIDKTRAITRNVDIQEFCVIDTALDYAVIYNHENYSSLRIKFLDQIDAVSWGTIDTLASICLKLSNNSSLPAPTCAVFTTKAVNDDGETESRSGLLPLICFPFGRSVVFAVKFDDNYAAASTVIDADDYELNESAGGLTSDKYAIEDHVPYVNKYGKCESISFFIADKIDKFTNDTSSSDYISNEDFEKKLFALPRIRSNTSNVYAQFSNYYLDKDSRERLRITGQLNFVTPNRKIEIYRAFAESMPFVGDDHTQFRYVIFSRRQDKFSEYVQGNYVVLTMPLIQYHYDTKHIRISGAIASSSGSGYGLITDAGKLCIYVEREIKSGDSLSPVFLMFRRTV